MKTKDWVLCVLVLAIWSSSSSLVSVFTKNSNPLLLASIVTIISSIILSLQLINPKYRKMLCSLKLRELCKLFFPALLGLFLYPIAYFIGISGSSAVKANVLNYLWPLIAFVTSGMLNKHRFVKSEIFAMLLSTVGGYIVLCFNNSDKLSFVSTDYSYAMVALLGAFFYGIYTSTIGLFCPLITDNSSEKEKNMVPLPANLRIFIMVSFSAIIHLMVIIIYLIIKPESLINTIANVLATSKTTLSLIIYSVVNFTLAHFLWNKLNTSANVALTASMAFLIPLASTIVLSITSNETIGFAPSFGLVFIVVSIIINNRKHINSINATFVSIIIMFMLTGIVPFIDTPEIIDNSKFFLEIIIALYSIYYGFVMSRVISEYKEFETLIDVISINKRNLSKTNQEKLSKIEKKLLELKKHNKEEQYVGFSEQIVMLIPQDVSEEKRELLENRYYQLYRCSNHALSISEWLVVLILSMLILVLCFVVRESTLLSNLVVVSIGATICLCVSSLYEYEVKKSVLLSELIE